MSRHPQTPQTQPHHHGDQFNVDFPPNVLRQYNGMQGTSFTASSSHNQLMSPYFGNNNLEMGISTWGVEPSGENPEPGYVRSLRTKLSLAEKELDFAQREIQMIRSESDGWKRMAEMLSQQLQSFSNSGGPPPPSANTYVHARRVTEAEHEHILRKTLPLAFDSTVPFVVDYNPEIHGNIDHWEEGSWSKKGESSSSGQLAAKLQFLQQLSGAEMEASKLKKAYNTVGSIFSTIKSVDSRILRPTWVDIHKTDKPFAHAVYKQIYAEYPEFSLCKDHWKIRKFLIGWYKPWYDKHVAPELGVVIKQEPPGEHKILGKRALPTGSTQDASKAKRKKALFPGPVNPTSLVTPPEAATSLVAPPVPESLSKPPQESETEAVSPSKTPTDAPPTAETPKNDALEPNTEAQVTSSPSRSASPLPPPKSPPTAAAQSGTTEPVPPAAKSFDDDIETPPPPPPRKEVALEGGTVKKRRGGKTKGSDSKGGGASARKRAGTKEAESKPATTTKMYYRQHWRTSNPDKRLAEFEEDWVKLSEAEKQEWATKFRNRNKA